MFHLSVCWKERNRKRKIVLLCLAAAAAVLGDILPVGSVAVKDDDCKSTAAGGQGDFLFIRSLFFPSRNGHMAMTKQRLINSGFYDFAAAYQPVVSTIEGTVYRTIRTVL